MNKKSESQTFNGTGKPPYLYKYCPFSRYGGRSMPYKCRTFTEAHTCK